MNNKLILRKLTSPFTGEFTDITKSNVLAQEDVDNNFIYLKGNIIYDATINGSDVILSKINGETISFNISEITGITSSGGYITGGTYSNGNITFTNNSGYSFTVTGITSQDTYVTGGTYSNGTAIFTNNTGGTFSVIGFSTGSSSNSVFITGASTNNNTKTYTLTNNTGGTVTITGLTDITITSGIYNSGTLTLTNTTGGTVSITGLTASAGTDTVVTGASTNNNTKQYIFTNNAGGQFAVTGLTDITITSGVYTGNTIVLTNTTGGTISITGLTASAGTDTVVTGASTNNNTKQYIFTNNAGGQFIVTGLTDVTITGGSVTTGGTLNLVNTTGGTIQITGLTASAGTDTVVTGATTNNNTKQYIFTNSAGGSFAVTGLTDVTITGGSYGAGVLFLGNNTGGTIQITGITSQDTYITGITTNNNTKTYTLTNTTGGTIVMTGLTDITITSGVYNSGTLILTNSTGGTVSITGLTASAGTDTVVTGASTDNNTKQYNFTNNLGNSFVVTGLTDITITGGSVTGSTLVFTNNTGGTFNITGVTNNQKIGIIFSDNFYTASNYIQTQTAGSQTFNNGYVIMSGGNSTFSGNKMIYKYNTNGTLLNDYTMKVKFINTVDGTSPYGFGLGLDILSSSQDTFAAFIDNGSGSTRGQIKLYNTFAGPTLATSTSKLSFNTTDVIEMSVRWVVSKVYCVVKNITTPTKVSSGVTIPNIVTVEWTALPTLLTTPVRMGRPCIYSCSGTQNVSELSMSSDDFQNPKLILIGDSRTYGLGCSTIEKSYANLIGARGYKNTVWARGGTKVADLYNNISELALITNGENSFVIVEAGVNDAINLRTLAQFQADYTNLLNAIISIGATPIITKMAYVGSSYTNAAAINTLITSYNLYVTTGLTGTFKVIDYNTATSSGGALTSTLTSDGAHYIDGGQAYFASILLPQIQNLFSTNPGFIFDGFRNSIANPINIGTGTQSSTGSSITSIVNGANNITYSINDSTASSYMGIDMYQDAIGNYSRFLRFNSGFVGNFLNTTISFASKTLLSGGGTFQNPLVVGFTNMYFLQGQTATNYGVNFTPTGVKIDKNNNLHLAATAQLHISSGSTTASTAPFKYTAGVSGQTVVENGAKNFDGSNEFIAANGVNYTIAKTLTTTTTLDFPSTTANSSSDLTVTLIGASVGDIVNVGAPVTSILPNSFYNGFVSTADTITVRFNNYDVVTKDPSSGVFRIAITKY